ncbi:hypothetical protein Pmar_PMAR004223 [Perkinsus marinus ATCC 50983]|uniref:Uncharacterized protein n=1 Tax=Perkinsus marinus (strain ATCC 50983 / TXsc) TaxID=423536 RepID=C5LPN0_PERM5|nr:hypothetical protein Pmar_PMAR004223 [Perkinsus marinus ATCC 50983]EER01350.1 hypothetical protein Pmar_PMAR004223 [Perkinsus marinus ATCC 50983]|eukprot:XP_002768632.1 hypothetical protein Pmar_PMAR004223 [Perkinsus marinus ATCC 50983]
MVADDLNEGCNIDDFQDLDNMNDISVAGLLDAYSLADHYNPLELSQTSGILRQFLVPEDSLLGCSASQSATRCGPHPLQRASRRTAIQPFMREDASAMERRFRLHRRPPLVIRAADGSQSFGILIADGLDLLMIRGYLRIALCQNGCSNYHRTRSYILTSYKNNHKPPLNQVQSQYRDCLCAARVIIEQAFGWLKMRAHYRETCGEARAQGLWWCRISSAHLRIYRSLTKKYVSIPTCYVDDVCLLVPATLAPFLTAVYALIIKSLGFEVAWHKLTMASSDPTVLGFTFHVDKSPTTQAPAGCAANTS